MTKLIFTLIVISSCSYIDYGQLPATIKDSIYGRDIVIDDEFYNAQKYSFAKIKIGKSIVAIAVLASASEEKYLWISQDGARIYTNNGRITKTIGLNHDVSILDGSQNIKLTSFINHDSGNLYRRNTLLELSNPHAIIAQEFTQLRKLKISLNEAMERYHQNFKVLSMGMSGDYKIALANGSTMIRIGSAIFGARNHA